MSGAALSAPSALSARGVRRAFGTRTALAGVDLDVAPGEVHGLLGRNGAGKTTLLRIVLGLVRADGGSLELLGRSRASVGPAVLDSVAGWAGTPHFHPRLTARQTLVGLARLDGGDARQRVDQSLDAVGLADRARDRVAGWSTGQRQRLALAAALLRAPRLLVLDEPASGLDPAAAADLRALLARLASEGTAVLLSSHLMGDIEALCSSVTVLAEGRVVASGTVAELRAGAGPPAVLLRTSDDEAALAAAASWPASGSPARLERGEEGLRLLGEQADRDAALRALAGEGIVPRALHPVERPLEDAFLRLTAEPGSGGAYAS